ncbi:MAG TPA: class I SAM-dependent methyltransferase [Baekduia sp.]|uniref:class I SAM-dependent methyltransferase n=1 Tax=Baekduia sp. TaxID=2600305 RepID=UPI002C84B456|nr:class I SAM-dependent methyltransferase [Baekduia sp.]HMJ34716.1 class I SAM-dependent methyltransferase [Baekduia sp.]
MPEPLLERARTSLRLRALDLRDRYLSRPPRADRLVPPRRLDFVGHSDFVDTGDEFLRHFVALGGLRSTERVLDIGCGIGRMARPLTRHLTPPGSYDGFDINAEGIAWCRRRYRAHPRFTFQTADLYNRRYNPAGAQSADRFDFPYADASFDFALATSVFTHLLEGEAERYVAEAARVLAPGGRLFATWFLLDGGSRAAIAAGRAGLPFLDADQPVAVVSDEIPEEAIAFDRGWLADTLTRHGLSLTAVGEGSWRGDGAGASFQDIVVATRVST